MIIVAVIPRLRAFVVGWIRGSRTRRSACCAGCVHRAGWPCSSAATCSPSCSSPTALGIFTLRVRVPGAVRGTVVHQHVRVAAVRSDPGPRRHRRDRGRSDLRADVRSACRRRRRSPPCILYRLATFYLPPIWGFFSLRWLERTATCDASPEVDRCRARATMLRTAGCCRRSSSSPCGAPCSAATRPRVARPIGMMMTQVSTRKIRTPAVIWLTYCEPGGSGQQADVGDLADTGVAGRDRQHGEALHDGVHDEDLGPTDRVVRGAGEADRHQQQGESRGGGRAPSPTCRSSSGRAAGRSILRRAAVSVSARSGGSGLRSSRSTNPCTGAMIRRSWRCASPRRRSRPRRTTPTPTRTATTTMVFIVPSIGLSGHEQSDRRDDGEHEFDADAEHAAGGDRDRGVGRGIAPGR